MGRITFLVAVIVLTALAGDADAVTVRYTNAAFMGLTADQRAAIERIAGETEAEARTHLPDLTRTFTLVVDVSRNVIPETGESGIAASPMLLRWFVDHRRPGGATPIIEARLRSTLLQLMHHLVRNWVSSGTEPPQSAWEAIVAEGLASAFAREVSKITPPWADYPPEASAWLSELLALSEDDLQARFAQLTDELPDRRRYVAYKVGVYVADRARANSGRRWDQLATMPADDILALARR